jgi:hypothetical protein
MRSIWLLLVISALSVAAQAQRACHEVAGGIVTNFIDSSDTLGSAAGDLAGGLGVHVISQEPGAGGTLLITVQHHWVTEAGDTISLDPGVVTLFPTTIPGFYAASYLNGVELNKSGTGRFSGATGTIYAWGAVDFNQGELVLRYSGRVCH